MSKNTTDSFIHEISLKTLPEDERELDIRLEASRHLYNACLKESLRKIALIRQSRNWQRARTLLKSKENTKLRKELFK